MPILSLDGLLFSGIAWKSKLLPNKDTETSISHCRQFTSMFYETSVQCLGTINVLSTMSVQSITANLAVWFLKHEISIHACYY